ncbi:transcriptional regulator [Halorientalis brevis]|uniref:Transcriptional regulator n=1 Tax=Halorientalis brevis TaxID=1126241 RepID=A0ABD6CCI2_9EURY|nr:transcriptional regulator [Halorientalis brevis]
MVKSTVRFSETVMDRVEEMVSEESFSSKSEFQRFAVELVLSEVADYEPEMLDFDELREQVLPSTTLISEAEGTTEADDQFYQTAARVRQFAIRGELDTAEEYIDTNYPSTDPRCMLLDELLDPYRDDESDDE